MNNKPVYIFFLEVLLWLPFMFLLWYGAAAWLTVPLTLLMRASLLLLFADWFAWVAQVGYLLDITTRFTTVSAAGVSGGVLVFTLNPLIFSYSLPFFAALSLASPAPFAIRIKRILAVWVFALLPVQVFSLCVSLCKSLLFDTAVVASGQLFVPSWGYEVVALSFQFVTLILPSVLPIMLWVWLYRAYLQQIAPQLRWHE